MMIVFSVSVSIIAQRGTGSSCGPHVPRDPAVVLMVCLMEHVLVIVFIQRLIEDVILFIARSYFFYFEGTAYSVLLTPCWLAEGPRPK